MKILITINDYSQLTGAEMYVYELGRELVLLGHDVTISARRVGGLIKVKSEQLGIKIMNFGDLDYSQKFDIIHLNTPNASLFISIRFKGTPMVYTSHSEYHVEKPEVYPDVRRYIAIRPSIQERWQFPQCSVIYNPIDFSRFCPNDRGGCGGSPPLILFPATFDPLRLNAVQEVVKYATTNSMDVLFCGIRKVNGYPRDYIEPLLNEHVKHTENIWHIEKLMNRADIIAGIEVGRTTVEGWACGKLALVYYQDYDKAFRENTTIKDMEVLAPPADIEKYNSKKVVQQILQVYNEAIDG